MRRRRSTDGGRLLTVLGLAGIAVAVVVFVISLTAHRGLPFEGRVALTVEVPDASRLRVADEVRVGGIRVGQVEDITAVAGPVSAARIRLGLDGDVGALPVDTTVAVRPASVLGATYVDLVPGTASATVPAGGELPASAARPTVAVTDLFDLFDEQASRDLRTAVTGFGDGLAGRGTALGETIAATSRLLVPLRSVTRTLAAPSAGLDRFLRAAAGFARATAPVAEELASLTAGAATTFAALTRDRDALAATIDAAAPTERAVTTAMRRLRPVLDDTARLSTDLRPGARRLPAALDALNATLVAGRPALTAVPATSVQLGATFGQLAVLSRAPTTQSTVRLLGGLMSAADTSVSVLAPAQVHCNIIGLAGQNFGSFTGSVGAGQGPALWNLGISTTGATGEALQAREPAPDLKVNYLPRVGAEECESNNEPATPGRAIGNPPTIEPRTTRETSPPPGARARAAAAGLLEGPGR